MARAEADLGPFELVAGQLLDWSGAAHSRHEPRVG